MWMPASYLANSKVQDDWKAQYDKDETGYEGSHL